MRVERLVSERRTMIAQACVGASGSVDELGALVDSFPAGVYEATFFVGDYQRQFGDPLPNVPFLDLVPYRFGIADARQHYHLPLKLTAWGFPVFAAAPEPAKKLARWRPRVNTDDPCEHNCIQFVLSPRSPAVRLTRPDSQVATFTPYRARCGGGKAHSTSSVFSLL